MSYIVGDAHFFRSQSHFSPSDDPLLRTAPPHGMLRDSRERHRGRHGTRPRRRSLQTPPRSRASSLLPGTPSPDTSYLEAGQSGGHALRSGWSCSSAIGNRHQYVEPVCVTRRLKTRTFGSRRTGRHGLGQHAQGRTAGRRAGRMEPHRPDSGSRRPVRAASATDETDATGRCSRDPAAALNARADSGRRPAVRATTIPVIPAARADRADRAHVARDRSR